MSKVAVRRALISVWDKNGIEDLARRLVDLGVELVSSGGTARALADAGVPVRLVADVTGAAEMLGGRVKTLHPAIHGGILADLSKQEHRDQLEAAGIAPFQLVVANLYPFEATISHPDVTESMAIEKIDIGGPAMIRAAAKNHRWVGVVTSTDQYEEVVRAAEGGGLDDELRARLAAEAFFHTAAYDAAIVGWMGRSETLPRHLVLAMERSRMLRYGENPHQPAGLYRRRGGAAWWDSASQLQGKEMSFNNMVDAEAAWRLVHEFDEPAAVVIKHTNASGAAVADSLEAAFQAAWSCDPVSAFGSVVAVNRTLDAATAAHLAAVFVEVVVAPRVDADALDVLTSKKSLRILEAPAPENHDPDLRRIEDGLLVQVRDDVVVEPEKWEVVTTVQPSPRQVGDLAIAWSVAAHAKSNAVVIVSAGAAVGVGAGDQSRVGAAERAVIKAGERAVGAVAASDAFFPFRDGLDVLAAAGVAAIVEPGGSKRDDEVIAAAEERGIALLFTGERHFKH